MLDMIYFKFTVNEVVECKGRLKNGGRSYLTSIFISVSRFNFCQGKSGNSEKRSLWQPCRFFSIFGLYLAIKKS